MEENRLNKIFPFVSSLLVIPPINISGYDLEGGEENPDNAPVPICINQKERKTRLDKEPK